MISADIRLVNGTDSLSGRLEVYSRGHGQWTTVCEDGFSQQDADVVCRMMGNDTNTYL